MQYKKGQIIDQIADFTNVGKDRSIMSRYIILDTFTRRNQEFVKLYVIRGYIIENSGDPQADGTAFNKPGDIEEMCPEYMPSKTETDNNFYFEIINDV